MKKLLLAILPLFVMLAACSKDGKGIDDGKEPGKVEAKELNLSFDVVMPTPAQPNPNQNQAQKSPSTFALSDVDENAVAVIDVLAFLENGATMEFAEWAKVAGGSIIDNGSISKKKFKANFTKLVQSPTHKYQFVVIANGRGPVQALFTGAGAITTGAEKESVMRRLTLEGVEGWKNKINDGGYLHMPMWGEGNKTVVTTGLSLTDIKLLRMLAKINVTLDAVTDIRSKFLLKSIDLYNYNKDGRLVPDAANLATISKVDKPTNFGVHTEGPVEYAATSVTEMEEEIYTFESKVPYIGVPAEVDLDNVICLVIGGEFSTDGKTTYYRVDLAKKNGQGTYDYMDILRNHGYKINITNVASSGYDTSYEAFKARAVNIDVDIEAWDEAEMDLSYDGQYQLGTNKNKLEFFAEGREQSLLVFADHPNGWKIDDTALPSWITIDPMSDNSNSTIEIKVTATAWAGPNSREGEFYIKAGLLRKTIKVEQSSDAELSIEVNPAAITFNKSAAQAKPIVVKTFPETLVRTITVSGDIEWMSGFSPADANGYNWETFEIQPKPNTTGATLSSTITISITHSNTTLTRAVTVDQRHTDIIFAIHNKPAAYSVAGGEVGFDVQSGAPWQLSVDGAAISDPGNIITLLTTAEQPESPITPVTYRFNLTPNISYAEKSASFYAKSSNLDFPSQMVEIKQGYRPLYLTLGSSLVSFGTTGAAQNVSVTTNAGWVVSSVSNDHVLPNASPTVPLVGQVQVGSVSALVDASGTVNLTPRTDYVGFGPAGKELTSVLRVESRTHPGATMIAEDITVKRNVPSVFSVASITPATVAIGGGNVTATNVASNASWTFSVTGATTYTHTAADFNTRPTTSLAVPANTTWAAKTITATVACTGHASVTKSYTQPGYSFAYSSGFPAATIPQAGGTYSVVFKSTTASPKVYVRTVVGTTTTVVSASQEVPAIATANGTKTVSMIIPAAWAGDRTVTLQWSKDNVNFVAFSPNIAVAQTGAILPNSYSISPTLTSSIAAKGQTYTVKATSTGQIPAIDVRILVNNALHKSGVIPVASLTSSTGLILDGNSIESTKGIVIQYKHPQTGDWTNFSNGVGTQAVGLGIFAESFWVMYPRYLPSGLMTGGSSNNYCVADLLGGVGWRLPKKAEIQILINNVAVNAAYRPVLIADPLPYQGLTEYLNYAFWSSDLGTGTDANDTLTFHWFKSSEKFASGGYVYAENKTARPICIKNL